MALIMLALAFTFISTLIELSSAVTHLGTEQDGKCTYYGGNPSGNACGYATVATSTFPFGYYAACGATVFDSGYGCGKCFEITCVGPYSPNPGCNCSLTTPSVIISCMDQCPECSSTHFDLDPTAMARIVGPGLSGTCGVIATKVRRVSCEYTTNIKIRAKSGTSEHWYGLHIDDIAGYGSVSSVQLKSSGTSSYGTTCDKSQGASFWICSGGFPLSVPMTVKLTNDNSDTVEFTDCISNFNGGAEFDCGGNFVGGGTPIPTVMTLSPTTKSPTTSPCGIRNIKFVTVTQSQMYWLAFYVEDICNLCGIITNVEVLDSSAFGSYVSGDNSDPRAFWAYDEVATNHGGYEYTAPITVKITNSNNEVLTFTDVLSSVDGDGTFNTNNNFCQSGVTGAPTSVTLSPVYTPTQSPVTAPACGKNVKFTIQTESQLWWLSFFVEDLCCGSVQTVEVKDSNNYPSFVNGTTQYDYWYFDNTGQSFTAPISVRVTNSNNEILTFTNIIQSVDPSNIYYANINFCESSTVTDSPSNIQTNSPTKKPTYSPFSPGSPTKAPTKEPSNIPTNSPTKKPSNIPTHSPTKKPTYSPFLPGSPTKAPIDPTPQPTNNPLQTKNPSMNPTIFPTNSPTELQCDDLCNNDDDDNNGKLRIKIIFKFPKWILYDFTNIECWFYNIFSKWFDFFDFSQYFTECDIDIIVFGGHEHLSDNLCAHEPCLRNKHEIRRVLLQNGNDGNISITLISNNENTYYVMNSFSLETMSNDIENKFINDFDIDLVVTMESIQSDDKYEDDDLNTNNDNGTTTIYIIIGIVLILSIILIIIGVIMFLKYRKKEAKQTHDIASTEMISGEVIGQSKGNNIVAADDDDDEEEDDKILVTNDEEILL